jgi:hypothetical protein
MKDLRSLIDVDVEDLMKKASAFDVDYYKNTLYKRQVSRTLPFDARNEVSADARFIASRVITHLWIMLVVFPIVAFILYSASK